jgi:hypothetical protein
MCLYVHDFSMETVPRQWLGIAADVNESQTAKHQVLERFESGGRFWAEKDHMSMSKKTYSINRDTSEREVSWLS